MHLAVNGRTAADVLESASVLENAHSDEVAPVVGDCTEAAVRDRLIAAYPEPDILILNGGSYQGLI